MSELTPKLITREEYIRVTGVSGDELVDDVNKSHLMALEGNNERTHAAVMRKGAAIAIDAYEAGKDIKHYAKDMLTKDEEDTEDAGLSNSEQRALYMMANSEQSIDTFTRHMQEAERIADKQEKAAGERYDRAQALRDQLGIKK